MIAYYTKTLYSIIKNDVLVLPSRMLVFFFIVAIICLPVVSNDPYLLRIIILACIYAIFTASWDLLSGFTGQMSFGHAFFFGVSAYAAALLNRHLHFPPWASIPIGALASVVAGLIIGIPCLRLRGTYLALTTLSFPIILLGIVHAFPDITGGELGISGLDRICRSRIGTYYIVAVSMLLSIATMWKLTSSKFGILLHAIREDEIALRASGINTTRYKIMAFCLSAFFAGIAGGLYAHFMRITGPSTLEVALSFQVVIWGVFGGIATIWGSAGAVFILFPIMEFFRFWPEFRMLIFSFIIIFILLYMPKGLLPWLRDQVEKECPRCKKKNISFRKTCRICTATLG
ncbi:MAG: branched-chain amino acid ABC transporter permease [Deltaproteobacteria bacterium]|nr:branched-chain amino acid ABC transporter permease [Deltaproteobacteria bacterium]